MISFSEISIMEAKMIDLVKGIVEEKNNQVPIIANVDVLVVGSGPSGLAASIASSRTGVSTMLIERGSCFGGVISQVGVEGFAWYRHENTVEAGGIAFEFEEKAIQLGGACKEIQSESQALDAEMFKVVADEMLIENGVKVLLHVFAVNTIVENKTIKGVIIESKSGRKAILAKRVIDCTGDGDIAAMAGAPFTKREKLASVTPVFHCRGVDVDRFKKYIDEDLKPKYSDWKGEWDMQTNGKEDNMFSPYLVKPFSQAIQDGFIIKPSNVDFGGSFSTISVEGEVTQLNIIFISGIDCTNVEDLTQAEILGRKSILDAIKVLNAYVPGFERARLRNFGMTIGTRESRQIVGHYYMTGKDVMEEGRFEDSIGIFPEFIDGNGILWIPTTGRYYQIPFRAILPCEIENLLVAGRSISGDIMAHASFRNMSCCVVTGQGAGVAAAESVIEDTVVSKVNIKKVQETLMKQNVKVF